MDGLVGQVTALLGGGLPGDAGQLTDLGSLLTTVRSLLGTAGLDTSLLSGLLTTVNGILANTPLGGLTTPLQGLVTTIGDLLAPATGGGGDPTQGGGPPTPGGGTTPGTTTPGATVTPRPSTGTPAANSRFTGYRATIGAIKVAKKRNSAKFTLSCPATAPKGCLIKVSGTVAGQKAIPSLTLALPRGASTPVTVTLSKSTAKRLKKKGDLWKPVHHTSPGRFGLERFLAGAKA